jgi:DNA-binding SARP family transcriptional activator
MSSHSQPRDKWHANLRIRLLNRFGLSVSETTVPLVGGSERLLAFFALHDRFVARHLVAATLWPEVPEHRAYANLRSALARLESAGRQALEIGPTQVRLADGVSVDLTQARALAERVIHPTETGPDGGLDSAAVAELSAELLPGWYEDWVMHAAADWQRLRLHALEALAGQFMRERRLPDAVIAARAAVGADPLRESARVRLIEAHLAEGNEADALLVFQSYERLLQAELGLHPTPRLGALVSSLHTVDQASRPSDRGHWVKEGGVRHADVTPW